MIFNLLIHDPLEQFEFVIYFSIFISNVMYTILIHISILMFFFINYNVLHYNNVSYFLQTLIYFVKVTLKSNLSMQTYPQFLYIFYLFLYILICNLSGMIAYSFTVTSALIITFFFSANFFIGSNIYGFLLNYSSYFNLFIPKGVPKLILPMLFLIEIISYFSRVISLAVRLFANMMSGHALLKILLSFAWTILNVKSKFFLFFIFPWIITIMVSLLEYVIAFLQAYVFLVLVIIYLTDVINLH